MGIANVPIRRHMCLFVLKGGVNCESANRIEGVWSILYDCQSQ